MTKRPDTRLDDFLNQNEHELAEHTILLALWYDAKGDWGKAHAQVDQLEGKDAAHIHAYLHRKEGDQWNADYWYRRAGVTRPALTLDEEWGHLVKQYYHPE